MRGRMLNPADAEIVCLHDEAQRPGTAEADC